MSIDVIKTKIFISIWSEKLKHQKEFWDRCWAKRKRRLTDWIVSWLDYRRKSLFDRVRKQAKCLEEISFVGLLISHNLPAQHAAIEISSLGTFRDEIISFVKSAILYLESSTTVIPYQPAFWGVQGIRNSLLSTLPVQGPDAIAFIGTTAAKTVSQKLCHALC